MSVPETPKQQEERVLAHVEQINLTLAGMTEAEAQTTLTLAVASCIVAISASQQEREGKALAFGEQVLGYVTRPDIVEWIKAGIIHNISDTPERKQ